MPLERKQIDKGFSNSNEAYQYYLIGRFQMTDRASENIRKAIGSFERSIEADPNFALGYVGLADAYCLINLYDVDPPKDAYEKARVAAEKALSLDDDMAEAHASLAYVKFYHQRDRAGAELEFRRAIQMNPSYAQAHHWFSLALAGMNRPVEAVDEAKIAQKLDPRSPSIKAATGIVYLFQRQNEQALAECDRALAISEGFVPALKVKRWVYEYTGDSASARDTFQKEISYAGGRPTDLGWRIVEHQLTSLSDGREKLVKELDSLVASDFVTQNPYTFAFEIALAYNHLGATDKALEWLERGEAANTHSMNFLAVDPRLDTLRDNPRFQRLIKKYSDNSKEKD